jgi:multisubunit Na+/H+ antiporter MnhB subunit
MSEISDPARRRFIRGIYASLFMAAVDIVLYILHAPGLPLFLCLFVGYLSWVVIRFLMERNKSSEIAPWYESKHKVALFAAILFSFAAAFAFLRNSDSFITDCFWAAGFLVIWAWFRYKDSRSQGDKG